MKNGTTKINNPKIIVENSAFVVEDHILRHHREEVHLLLVRPLVHPSIVQGVEEYHLVWVGPVEGAFESGAPS